MTHKCGSDIRSDQSLSHVRLCDPWIAARQASLSITNSRSSLELTSIKSVMPSNHLILCPPLLLLPSNFLNIRVWFPLEWTGWISLRSKGLSRVFSHIQLLVDPMDCSPPGSSVHGLLQARILEWVAILSSRGSSRPRNQTRISCCSCTAGGFFTNKSRASG